MCTVQYHSLSLHHFHSSWNFQRHLGQVVLGTFLKDAFQSGLSSSRHPNRVSTISTIIYLKSDDFRRSHRILSTFNTTKAMSRCPDAKGLLSSRVHQPSGDLQQLQLPNFAIHFGGVTILPTHWEIYSTIESLQSFPSTCVIAHLHIQSTSLIHHLQLHKSVDLPVDESLRGIRQHPEAGVWHWTNRCPQHLKSGEMAEHWQIHRKEIRWNTTSAFTMFVFLWCLWGVHLLNHHKHGSSVAQCPCWNLVLQLFRGEFEKFKLYFDNVSFQNDFYSSLFKFEKFQRKVRRKNSMSIEMWE